MCRKVVFSGHCSECKAKKEEWRELTQELSCLQAKNAGRFGACERGVYKETHPFVGVCDECDQKDEGLGILEVDDNIVDSAKDFDFFLYPHGGAGRAEKPENDKQGKKRVASAVDDTDDEDIDDGVTETEPAQKKKQKT